MDAPLASLLLLTAGPWCIQIRPRAGGILAGLLAALAAFQDGGWRAATALGVAVLAGVDLRLLRRWRAPAYYAAACWGALLLLPWWAPLLGDLLAGFERPQPAWLWRLWPGSVLVAPSWDPALLPGLYQHWGARMALPGGAPLFWLGGLAALAFVLYSIDRRLPAAAQASSEA